MPKVIEYDDATGAPIGGQDTKTKEMKEPSALVKVPWKEWMASEVAKNLDVDAAVVAAATLVLRSLHHKGDVHMQSVDVKMNLDTKQRTVVAAAGLKHETLELPPCAPASGKVHATSRHPFRVPIGITQRADVRQQQRLKQKTQLTKMPTT